VWLAVPGLLANETADEAAMVEIDSTIAAVPTPDYGEIAPEVTATPVPTGTLRPQSTSAPVRTDDDAPRYVLDLWLDGSPNIAGISPFDSETNRGTNYGQWTGGFFYSANSQGDESKQQGWMPSLLNMLYGTEAAGSGSVRILRFCAENMLSRAQLDELQQTYELDDTDALVRDTLTYHVLYDTSGNHRSFFEGLLAFTRTSDLRPGSKSNNPYAVMDGFYTPDEAELNNRTVIDERDKNQQSWDWRRETANDDALKHADQMVDSAIAAYQRKLESGSQNSSASSESSDYLYYALSAMDASRLNVVVVDTLGLPPIDQHTGLYTQRIDEMTRLNGGDLSVGCFVFQLDYAGKISTIGGRQLENGFLWGYENFYYRKKINEGTPRWSYIQPMPRALTMLVIGPSAQVHNYTDVLCQRLNREMEDGGLFSSIRGTTAGKIPEGYQLGNSFLYLGASYRSPEFGFKYKYTVMEYKDVVAEQRSLMSTLSQRLAQTSAQLRFDTETQTLENDLYEYVTTLGNAVNQEDVPVITTALNEPITIAVDLGLTEGDSFAVGEGQYDSEVTVVSALETQSFTLEEIDSLSRSGGLDLSETSDILQDQAYIDENGRIYKYHRTDGSSLLLDVTTPAVVDGELQVVISTNEAPAPGYYWVTLDMRSKTLAELDNANWNTIQPWMALDADANGFEASDGPAVLADYRYSWDYTPNSSELNNYEDIDRRLGAADSSANAIADADGNSSKHLHHAWGSGSSATSGAFPANIPPVFRAFQLNRIASSIRDGLLDRSGAMDSASFLTRHFIICVPEPTTAGAE